MEPMTTMTTKLRSEEEICSFVQFCNDNPELRFWQALLAWVDDAYDWESSNDIGQSPDKIQFHWGGVTHLADPEDRDTFYMEWAGPHPIGPAHRVD